MSFFRLLLREAQHRWLGFVLSLVAVSTAVGLFVAVETVSRAARRETTRLMRDLGFNVLILPRDEDMAGFWSRDFAGADMPEEYVHRLARSPVMSIRHLVARLQKRFEWRGRQILLTGILPEAPQAHLAPKPPMGLTVPEGQVYLGYEIAESTGIGTGETLELGGKRFRVARALPQKGSKDDIRIYGHLHDVQQVLGMPGRINEIEALSCRCQGDRLARIRKDVEAVLPGTRVIEFRSIAIARAETRRMIERYAALIVPAVLAGAALWVGLLALMNVRERRREIGVLRAVGAGSGRIALLFLGRAALLALVGAALGFVLGTALAVNLGPEVFRLTGQKMRPAYALLGWSVLGALLACISAAYVPTLVALAQDPARALTEE